MFISCIGRLLGIVPFSSEELCKTPNQHDGSGMSDCPSSVSVFTWRTVAAVFDRFMFLLYMIGVLIVFIVSFPRGMDLS